MKRKNLTRSALFTSILSLLLCVSMLVGTTFAWFTDTAVTGINTITAGNLDIEVLYAYPSDVVNGEIPDNAWKTVNAQTPVFNPDALWEPGYTEVVYFKIVNAGSLALKYKMSANIVSEVPGTNVYGAEFKLSEHLKAYYMNTDEATVFADRVAAQTVDGFASWWPALTPATLAEAAAAETGSAKALSYEVSLEPNETAYTSMAVFMPTTVGNEANYMTDTTAPQINLGISVVATQYNSEEEVDSYDKDYDKDAEYPEVFMVSDMAGLKAAFAEGGNIVLTNDIAVPETLRVEPGVVVNLDLNGKKITVPNNSTSGAFNALFYSENGGDITITGNGTVDLGENGMSLVVTRGNVTIENGTFTRKVTDPNSAYPLISDSKYADGNGVTTIYGGYFDGGYYNTDAATFAETAADEATRGQPGDKNAYRVAIKDNIMGTMNVSKSTFKVYGGTFVGANPAWGDEGCALPIEPNYLRPWSYYQGTFIEGQQVYDDKIELPAGFSIEEGVLADGRPTYTVKYSK